MNTSIAGGERRTEDGIHFIRTRGTNEERVRQHARLLRDEILAGALPVLAKKNEGLIRRGPGLVQKKPVQDLVVWFYNNVVVPALDRNTDDDTRTVVRVLAEETGMSPAAIRGSLFQADGLMLLSRTSMMKYLLKDLPAGGLPGCTSGVVLRDWTKDGRLLVCRNQDYPIIGPWEPATTLLFQEPSEKGQIPHVSLTSAGVHTAGLTSMNREGLTLSVHAHFGREVSFRGQTVLALANEIIRSARTIGEAVDLARKARRHANWAYVVSSARENDAVVIEMTPTKTVPRHPKDGLLVHSNFFHEPELQNAEALLSGACCDDLVARVCRMRELLTARRGSLEPADLARVLGDHVDPQTGDERVFGNTISVITTVKSLVFDPGAQKMWISNRGESPMGLDADYVEVDVDRFWSRPAGERLARVHGYVPRNPRLVEGVRHYREAYKQWHMRSDDPEALPKTLVHLRKAARAYPEDGNVWIQTGIVAFRGHEFAEARSCFTQAQARRLTPHTRLVSELYLARCLDVLGSREEALAIYRRHATGAAEAVLEPKIHKAMLEGARRPYRPARTRMMQVDLQFPDTFQY